PWSRSGARRPADGELAPGRCTRTGSGRGCAGGPARTGARPRAYCPRAGARTGAPARPPPRHRPGPRRALAPAAPTTHAWTAEMEGGGGARCGVGGGGGDGGDEVVAGEIEPADRERKQRQIVAVPLGGPRQALDERGNDAPALDRGRDAARDVQEREERRVREELAEHLEAALAAAHPRQPIVNQGDPRARSQAGCP